MPMVHLGLQGRQPGKAPGWPEAEAGPGRLPARGRQIQVALGQVLGRGHGPHRRPCSWGGTSPMWRSGNTAHLRRGTAPSTGMPQ